MTCPFEAIGTTLASYRELIRRDPEAVAWDAEKCRAGGCKSYLLCALAMTMSGPYPICHQAILLEQEKLKERPQ